MVRNNTEKSNDTEPKKPRGKKQQTQQVIEPVSDSPTEISDPYSKMFNSLMPMILLLLMFAILTPMLKRVAQNDRELKDK